MQTERALRLITIGRDLAADRGFEATIAVHDAAGHPVALARGRSWHGPYMAMGKARLAAAFRKPTADLIEQWKDRPLFPQSLVEILPGGVTLNAGGYPIFEGDELAGAIGVGGSSPPNDHELAEAIVAAYPQTDSAVGEAPDQP
jgi:uncharacterized protein GlcG (DUF336 family)